MSLVDLVTRQDVEALAAKLDQVLQQLAAGQPGPASDFMTLDQVAAYTHFDKRTVRQWVAKGRYNEEGKRIYLPAYQYADLLRFKRADVEAFGLGIGVLTPPVLTDRPQPVKKPKKAPVASEAALRVA